MAIWLRKSTTTKILLGPFVSSTDGYTPNTTASLLVQSDIQLWRPSGTSVVTKNESSGSTHAGNGMHYTTLDNTTDTATAGPLIVTVNKSGCLPVRHNFIVAEAQVWDSFFAVDYLKVDLQQIDGTTNPAVRLGKSANQIIPGTVDTAAFTPTTTELEADDITEATADHYNGRVIVFTSGALAGQATTITDYALSGANGHFTVDALTEAPANNDAFVIV